MLLFTTGVTMLAASIAGLARRESDTSECGELAAAGVAAGALLSLGAAKAVAGALSGVSVVDPITWIGVTITLFGVTAAANLVPARRASAVDPFTALRAE